MAIELNTDKKQVKRIKHAIKENNGYCPCKINKIEDNRCICKEFRDKVSSGYHGLCHCGLYMNI